MDLSYHPDANSRLPEPVIKLFEKQTAQLRHTALRPLDSVLFHTSYCRWHGSCHMWYLIVEYKFNAHCLSLFFFFFFFGNIISVLLPNTDSWDTPVGIVKRLRAGSPRNRGSIPGRGKYIFPPESPIPAVGSYVLSLLFIAYWVSVVRVKWVRREAEHWIHLVPTLTKSESILSLAPVSSWWVQRQNWVSTTAAVAAAAATTTTTTTTANATAATATVATTTTTLELC